MTRKWFILAIVLIALWFIWFEIRPMLIRQNCQELARESGIQYFNSPPLQAVSDIIKKSQIQVEYMEGFYNRCLHDKGIQ